MRWVPLAVLLVLSARLAPAQAPEPAAPVHLVIVGTTDVHGHVEERVDPVEKPGSGTIRHGGLAAFAGELANLRASEPGRVVWLDSGDEFQGTLLSNVSEGGAVVKAFGAAGLAAAAVGNHEFDFGPLGPDAIARKPGDDPLGAMKRNAALASYPFLAANMVEKATGKCPPWARPSILLTVSGVKLGILGLATPSTPATTNPRNVESLQFTDPVKAAVETARSLRAAGADAVVALAHMGGGCREGKGIADLTDLNGCDATSEAFELLAALPKGTVDLLLGGHTHRVVRKVVNGTPMSQGPALAQAFSVVDLFVDTAAHRVLPERTVLHAFEPVCAVVYANGAGCDPRRAPEGPVTTRPATFAGKAVTPDAAIERLLEPYREKVAFLRSQGLGVRLAAPFTKNWEQESTLGDLVADALREAAGADVALQNNGGLRTELRALSPTYGDLFEVLPFDNFQATARLTPAELRTILAGSPSDRARSYQISGIRAVIDRSVTPATVTLTDGAGQPLDEARRYLVATSDFLLEGGEGLGKVFTPATEPKVLYGAPLQRDAVAEVLKRWGAGGKPLEPKTDGRLTVKAK